MTGALIAALLACATALLATVTPAFAHRMDEYLQAATIGVSRDSVVVRLRLTAGVAAASRVLRLVDANGDGTISGDEQRSYSELVRRDLTVGIDGRALPLTITTSSFPSEAEMREGLGDIVLTFSAALPRGTATRRLTLENRHQRSIAVYLVNTLVPEDPAIRVIGQDRARDQSSYRLDFVVGSDAAVAGTPPGIDASLARSDNVALVRTYFGHGVHHILSGFDHLLFLAALVLGAATLWELVKVVTAFTIAHSVTLTFAALGWVHLPSGVVEPLIAASIVFVAVQNVFWPGQSHGRARLLVAFLFGLFHGLGFAGGLLDVMHHMPTTLILLAILGFSLGVETGNQLVLLPLFALLAAARRLRSPDVSTRYAIPAVQRIGSAAVSVAGAYYLCVALVSAL